MEEASNSKIELFVWFSQLMGGLCSRSAEVDRVFANADSDADADAARKRSNVAADFTTAPHVRERMERNPAGTNADEDFYDGIPLFPDKPRAKHATVSKLSEVSLLLGRAGTTGFGKAVEVLDTLGSSMANLNAGSGFVSGAAMKGNEISILAFEVANTIVKGFTLLQSLSTKSIKHLKEEVLLSEPVQDLVSKDKDELLRIVAADKRQELKVFSGEVIRFGNRSKDPQWHNLDRYFEKISKDFNAQSLSRDEAESKMQQLMTLVQFTAELYHELHALDRFEQDIQRKLEEEDQRGDNLAFLRADIKSQKKQIKHLKKKSLWSRSLEEVLEKLVEVIHFLHLEISNTFGSADGHKPIIGHIDNRQRLGPAGLALHYANIVLQIDTLVARSSSMPVNTRDSLYQNLRPNIKLALRSKLPSFHVVEEIIPQSVCSRYGLAIGASVTPFVRVLVWICYPVAFPISKLLDYLLGHRQEALFRRAELKTLVNMHGNEAGKGGELTHDETTIIAGALELSEKTASDAMTPISETFAIDINSKLDRELMNEILEKGHSRVPVYYEQPTNIIGLVLIKNLLTTHPEDESPVKSVTIRRIPRVPESMPLYDILNEFQKGHSHMAVVVRRCDKNDHLSSKNYTNDSVRDVKVDIDGEKPPQEKVLKPKMPLQKWKSFPNTTKPTKGGSRSKKWSKNMYSDILDIDGSPLPTIPEEEEAVGIITMEDVIEELLQEEIFDETDHHFNDS